MFSPTPPTTFGCETDGCISSVAHQGMHQDTCRQHVFTRRHIHTCRRMCSHASIANAPRGEKHTYIFYMSTLHTCTKHGRQSRPPTRDQRHPHRKPTRLEPHWPAPRRPRCIAPSGAGNARDEAVSQGAHCPTSRAVWTTCTFLPDIASLFNGNRAVSLSDRQLPPLCLVIGLDVSYVAR